MQKTIIISFSIFTMANPATFQILNCLTNINLSINFICDFINDTEHFSNSSCLTPHLKRVEGIEVMLFA